MFETFFQSHRLDRKDLLAAAVPAARIVWDKRGRIDRALQRKRFPIQRKAYKPVILTAFCLIGRHPAQPTPSEAVPVSSPDGTTPLTAAELDWFGRCFFNVVPGWGPNRFLTCAYDRPEDMDLAAVLACGPEGSWNVTSQERDMIAAGETDNVVRIPLEQAQELMLRYTGLALSDTQGVGLDSLRYLSEYNAYYRVGDEAEAAYCRILSGWHTADGLTVLQYDGGTVTLRQLDGRWVFVSNVLGRSA